MISANIAPFILLLFPLMLAICLHEAAHAWTSHKFGDNTAYAQGRVTLNPIKHIDLVGTIIVPIAIWFLSNQSFVFGWAKPVPFNPRNLKNFKHDASWIAAAGPISNLLMVLGWTIIMFILSKINYQNSIGAIFSYITTGNLAHEYKNLSSGLILMAFFGIQINLILAIFNLIPIPPLDGGHIMQNLLPPKLSYEFEKIKPFGIFILIALVYFNILPIGKLVVYIINNILKTIF